MTTPTPADNLPKMLDPELDFLHMVHAVHKQLLDTLNFAQVDKLQDDVQALNLYLLHHIEQLVNSRSIVPDKETAQRLIEAVFDEVTGFGPASPLLRDESITDIFINSPDTVFIERSGRVERANIQFVNDEHIFRLVQRVASKAGRHLDLGTPYFDAQLEDGSRIHAIIPPIAIDGIKVSIRKYQFQKLDIWKLVEGGALTKTMAEFLQIAVKSRFNIAICGGTGSGKTTLMNSILTSIRKGERMITIEDTPELELVHENTVRLLTRNPNPEGKGGVNQSDLMINALRMRPDRVILGELRGAEAFNMLHAMNTGQDGSMVTLHASGAEEVISRLLNMILMARYALSVESIKQQIGSALDLIVHVSRLVNGSRRIMAISQVSCDMDGNLKIEEVFKFNIEKIDSEILVGQFEQFNLPPTTKNHSKLVTAGLLKEYEALFKNSGEKVDGSST